MPLDPASWRPFASLAQVRIDGFAARQNSFQNFRNRKSNGHRTHTLHHQARRRRQERYWPDLRPFEAAGLKVVAAKMVHLSRGEAEQFYGVHKERPFFKDLVDFMVSGPVMIQALEGDSAIAKNRDLMGATDPKKAAAGTIRADFADSIDANAVHGSDAPETAAAEVAFFFPGMNVYSR